MSTVLESATAPQPSRDDLLDQARELGALAWSHRAEQERDRRMPDHVIDAFRASGLVKLCRHRRWGGAEGDPMTLLDVAREFARGSAALGWLYSLLAFHDWYMAFTTDELQNEVWGSDPDGFVVDNFAPLGQIERVRDGYLVSGNWKFTSGIEWASWVAVGGVAAAPDGEVPENLAFFVPTSEVTVHDDWYPLGLRGTASRAIEARRLFVPDHRVFPHMRIAHHDARGDLPNQGPLWNVPLMTMMGMCIATTPLGVAQRMVDEYTLWTRNRVRPFKGNAAQREEPSAQLALAAAATQWDATWALAQKYAQEGWDHALRGDCELTEEERAKYFAWRGYLGRSSAELCQQLFLGSGGSAIADSHPLQQLLRDVHAGAVHIGIDSGDGYTSRGRVAMGLPGHPYH